MSQQTLERRGHKDDPLYKIRGLLRHGQEHLSERQRARLDAGLTAGDPTWEVTIAWNCYQQLRAIYHAPNPIKGRRLAETVIATLPTCPIPEVARLGRTLRAWRAQVLAYFATGGVSNGGTEAINLLIEKTRSPGPRLPQLRPLPTTHRARRSRRQALPTSTYPRLDPKSQ